MSQKIIIYTTNDCPHCARAKALLKRKNLSFQEVDVTHDQKKRDELEEKTGWMTVPMIFIGEEFIGGADDLFALESSGKLDRKLSS